MSQIGPTILLLTLTGLGSFPAAASDPPPADLLKGPQVDREARESNLGMLENGAMQRAIRRTAVPARRWFAECDALELRPEQAERIAELKAEFNVRSQAYLDLHGERLKTLRDQIRRHDSGRETAEPAVHQARLAERARLQADAPQVGVLQQAVWRLLEADQQDALRGRLETVRKEIRRRQAIERLKEQGGVTDVPVDGSMESMMPAPMSPGRPGEPGRLPGSLDEFD